MCLFSHWFRCLAIYSGCPKLQLYFSCICNGGCKCYRESCGESRSSKAAAEEHCLESCSQSLEQGGWKKKRFVCPHEPLSSHHGKQWANPIAKEICEVFGAPVNWCKLACDVNDGNWCKLASKLDRVPKDTHTCIRQGFQQTTAPLSPRALIQGSCRSLEHGLVAVPEVRSMEPESRSHRLHVSLSTDFRALYWSLICD